MAANASHGPDSSPTRGVSLDDRRRRHEATARESVPTWGKQLEACCAVLASATTSVMTASALTGHLDDSQAEATVLEEAARRLAAEHGLGVTVDVQRATFMVRFIRRARPMVQPRVEDAAPVDRSLA